MHGTITEKLGRDLYIIEYCSGTKSIIIVLFGCQMVCDNKTLQHRPNIICNTSEQTKVEININLLNSRQFYHNKKKLPEKCQY